MEISSFRKKEILSIGIFIGLIVFFLFDFGWVIPLDKPVSIGTTSISSIPILPVLMSFILLIPLYFWAYHSPHKNLQHYLAEELKSIIKVFLLIFTVIMIFRTIVLLRYGLPLEKTPMIFFIGIQILYVECYYMSDFGFHMDKIWRQIFFTFLLLGIIGVLFICIEGPIILGLSLVGILDLNSLLNMSISINWYVIASFPFQLICVGVSEELLFRGYFYTKLRSTNIGYIKSILVSSVFFGLFHVCWYISPYDPWFISDAYQMVFHVTYTFIFGICMCIIFERTKSLVAPIIIHGLSNSVGGAVATHTLFDLPIMSLYAEIWLIGLTMIFIIPLFFIFVIYLLPRITKFVGVESKTS
ncbi:MAG: lysostaphin resistance A-like protein [Candidatus Helarchaeota archaeon]